VSFNAILGFLVIFRSQQAYSRYWEGLTLLQQVRGQWFNATSSLVAFCTMKPDLQDRVNQFRLLQVRLTSMLYCAGLRTVATMKDDDFEVIEVAGLDEMALDFMHDHPDPCIVILQWMQQHIVSHMRSGVLDVPPPVMSRVFQELSQGIVSLADAQKIADTPFPFSSAQMIAVMMTCQWIMAPVISASLTKSWAAAGVAAFFTVFLISCLNLIASEIEIPFGDDPNDLPLGEMQDIMNVNLKTLLNTLVNTVPDFSINATTDQNRLVIWSKNFEPVHPDLEARKIKHKTGLRTKADPKAQRTVNRKQTVRDASFNLSGPNVAHPTNGSGSQKGFASDKPERLVRISGTNGELDGLGWQSHGLHSCGDSDGGKSGKSNGSADKRIPSNGSAERRRPSGSSAGLDGKPPTTPKFMQLDLEEGEFVIHEGGELVVHYEPDVHKAQQGPANMQGLKDLQICSAVPVVPDAQHTPDRTPERRRRRAATQPSATPERASRIQPWVQRQAAATCRVTDSL